MALEQHDGLEFPFWLWALPGAVVLKAVVAPATSVVVEPEPVAAPLPGPALPSVAGPTVAPSYEPGSAPTFEPPPPQAERRVSEAIRAAAHASAVSQATSQVSAAIEAHVQKQVSGQSAAKLAAVANHATAAFKHAVSPERVARETVRIEKKLRAEADTLLRAGVSVSGIEALAKSKTSALRKQAENAALRATAPLRDIARKVPAPLRKDVERAVAPLQKSLEQEASRALAPLKKQAEKTAAEVGEKLGLDQARKLAGDTLKKLQLPNIPVTLPTELTVSGVKDAVYSAGKKKLQEAMQSAIGFSIPLPNKFSAKELERTVTGLLPRDAKEALEKGLDLGVQAASSALSSALVGATVGSAIPGLGTVIGLGVALGIGVLKSALLKALKETHSYQLRCKSEDKYKSKLPELSPIELLPWIAKKRFEMSKAIAEEEKRTGCGLTPYNTGLRQLGQQCFEISKSTVGTLGLPQLDRLIPLYSKAPVQEWRFDKGQVQRGGAVTGGSRQVVLDVSATGRDLAELLRLMVARKAALTALVAQANNVDRLQPSELAPLRYALVTEIGHAALQYQLTASGDAKAWLGKLGGLMGKLVKREAASVAAMKTRYDQDAKREAELKKQGKTGVVTGIV